MCMTRSLDVMPKITEQHLIVRSGKSEAEVTVIKDCTRGITLLKLTADGHKASHGLSATAVTYVKWSLYIKVSSIHVHTLQRLGDVPLGNYSLTRLDVGLMIETLQI